MNSFISAVISHVLAVIKGFELCASPILAIPCLLTITYLNQKLMKLLTSWAILAHRWTKCHSVFCEVFDALPTFLITLFDFLLGCHFITSLICIMSGFWPRLIIFYNFYVLMSTLENILNLLIFKKKSVKIFQIMLYVIVSFYLLVKCIYYDSMK